MAPEKMADANALNTTTLLASYPGSGKRLAWRVLEALTGKITKEAKLLVSINFFDSKCDHHVLIGRKCYG